MELTGDQTMEPPCAEPSMMMLPSEEDSGMLEVPQQSKWGFNPGSEDTLDFNLELHGRMMMGDTTHGHLFGDTTGDTADSDPDSPSTHQATAPGTWVPERDTTAGELQKSPLQPDESSAPKWTAPAFLPPYLSGAPQPVGAENESSTAGEQEEEQANRDHPALVMDTAIYSEMTQSTMDTRRDSFFSASRRQSITSGVSPAQQQRSLHPAQGVSDADGHRFSPRGDHQQGVSPDREGVDPLLPSPPDSEAPPSAMHAALRRSSNASGMLGCEKQIWG